MVGDSHNVIQIKNGNFSWGKQIEKKIEKANLM